MMKVEWNRWILLPFLLYGALGGQVVADEGVGIQRDQTVLGERILLARQPGWSSLSNTGEPFIQCAMEKVNQPYEIIHIPWERAQWGTKTGAYDGFFMASQNQSRDVYATFSHPFVMIRWFYVLKKNSPFSPEQENFHSLVFSANLGSARLTWLEKRYQEGKISKKIEAVGKPEQMIRMLLADRIDVALMNDFDLDQTLKILSASPSRFKTFLVREIPTAIYFSKKFLQKKPFFLKEINTALVQCKEQSIH